MNAPETPAAVRSKIGQIPIPAGTLLYDPNPDFSDRDFQERRKLEGLVSFGVKWIAERKLKDTHNYIPQENWSQYDQETIPATIVVVGGMGAGFDRNIVIERHNLKAEEINHIIALCYDLNMAYEYYDSTKKHIQEVERLSLKITPAMEGYSLAKTMHPEVFSAMNTNYDVAMEERLKKFGLIIEELNESLPKIVEEINGMIRQLDDLKVLAIENVSLHSGKMWWPIKKFIDDPFPGERFKTGGR